MQDILEGLLNSQQDRKVKHAMLQKIRNSGQQGQSVSGILAMFNTTTRLILKGETQYGVDACKDIYKTWAGANCSTLSQFVTDQFVSDLLTVKFQNSADAVWILQESFVRLQSKFGHTPQFQQLCVTVKDNAINFLRDNPQYETVAAFCELLFSFTQCIPQKAQTLPFCATVIYSVAGFWSPSEKDTQVSYLRAVNITIGKFLDHLWKHSDHACVMHCLKTIFDMISFVDEGREVSPSFALAGIVQYLPTDLIENIAERTTGDSNISDDNLQSAVMTMVDWLTWPGTQNIDLWAVAFLKGLATAHKYTILMEVVELTIEKVFSLLEHPLLRKSCYAVLEHMLLSFQHSPEPFHKIVGKVPNLVRVIHSEQSDVKFLTSLSELMHTLMHQYPGFPDLYEPVMEVLKGYQRPSHELMKRRLSQTEWGWQHQKGSPASYNYMASTSPSRFGPRSQAGKAGLVNLGNTCYMNSVIQALYMCDSFRQELLSASPSLQQPVLQKLQHVFALLSATQRAALSPSQLLEASRPSWFQAGSQQDCSEYLKYVLDQLHEQEMCRLRRETEMRESRLGGGGNMASSSSQQTSPRHSKFKFLSGKKSEADNTNSANLTLDASLIQKTFGGKVVNAYKCLKCKNESSRMENFTDLTLAFPEGVKSGQNPKWSLNGGASATRSATANQKGSASSIIDDKAVPPIALEELLAYYLSPEKLEGENKYHCDKCKNKQDAERTIQVVETPEYLILTLLRFSYNVKTQSRSKIFADVQYPKFLQIPMCSEPPSSPSASSSSGKKSKANKSKGTKEIQIENYALAAVIVHSGYTSDGGHYYCYARHSVPVAPSNSHNGGPDPLQDKWYMFNDNRVTASSYESFSNVTQKFAKDTVYVLMYKKILPEEVKRSTVDPNVSINPGVLDPPLRRDLRELVDRDNKKFLQEQEHQERNRALQRRRSGNFSPSAKFYNWKDDDNNGPPGSCGGGGMGGFSPRLVF